MIYLEYISPAYRTSFEKRVREVSATLGIRPEWLMTVMYAESRVNHLTVNQASGATGLIQFLPSTAASLGTSTAALRGMTPVQQLDYVLKYLVKYKGRMTSVYETYFAVFYPAALGKSSSYVLFSRGTAAYTNNAPLDVDRDGRVTKADVKSWFGKYVQSEGSNLLLYAGFGLGALLIKKLIT